MNPTVNDGLAVEEARRRQSAIDRLLTAEGAGHVVHDLPTRADGRMVSLASRPWRLDPLPYVITADEFAWISEAVARRMSMFEAILEDLHGELSLVADGTIDPAKLWGTPAYRVGAVGQRERRATHRWLSTYSVDLVRSVDGVWFAISDHTDSPVGLGYTLLDRNVLSQVVDVGHEVPRPIDPALALVRRALVDTATVAGPRVVVLTSGIEHPAYVEHSYMATQLGFNVVEGPDLVVRDGELLLQTLGGLERVDVVYRRIGDRQFDPLEANSNGSDGIPGVLWAERSGSLSLANAYGSGVIEDASLIGRWDVAGERLTGEAPWLSLVSPRVAQGSTRIDDLLGRPAERVACFSDDCFVDLPIVLRFHAVATDDGISVVPGANGRVIQPSDDPTLPTPCRAKDVWVLGDEPAVPFDATVRSAPQVDFITSVPTRAADSLYWLGRASERAEAVARSMRAIATAPPLASWSGRPTPAMRLLAALTGSPIDDADDGGGVAGFDPSVDLAEARRRAVVAAAESLEFHIGSMLAESASVREFLSATTGRVLGEMVVTRATLRAAPDDVDALDTLLLQLSAFGGLWSESVVRGPAWYFGDFAKRYERATVALTGAAMAMRIEVDTGLVEVERRRGLEAVLAANDSLVAYRRRHRSDVEIGAVLKLLLSDDRNPRSAAASAAGLVRNARAIDWVAGVERLERLETEVIALADSQNPAGADRLIAQLHELAVELTSTRLVAPPHPRLVVAGVASPDGSAPR